MNPYRLIFISFFLLLHQLVPAQGKPVIKASVDKNRVLLGEPFTLVIESTIPSGSVVRPVIIDTIHHFEFREKPVIDTLREAKGLTIKAVYQLASFDSGHWVIPSYSLSATIKTDTIPMDVVFSDFDPNQDYHDIKDIIEVETPGEKNKWWLFIIGAVVIIGGAIFLMTRGKKTVKPVAITPENAYADAISQLEKLNSAPPPAKEYYSKLISIFRVYVFKRKGILSLQKTTDDLILQLQGLQLNKESADRLAQALRLSDFVKFARFVPATEDDRLAFNSIKKGIEEIEQLS